MFWMRGTGKGELESKLGFGGRTSFGEGFGCRGAKQRDVVKAHVRLHWCCPSVRLPSSAVSWSSAATLLDGSSIVDLGFARVATSFRRSSPGSPFACATICPLLEGGEDCPGLIGMHVSPSSSSAAPYCICSHKVSTLESAILLQSRFFPRKDLIEDSGGVTFGFEDDGSSKVHTLSVQSCLPLIQ